MIRSRWAHLPATAVAVGIAATFATVAAAQGKTEDVEEQAPAKAPPAAEPEGLPWYIPPPNLAFRPPPPPPVVDMTPKEEAAKGSGVTLSANVEPTFFFGSNVPHAGAAAAIYARFTSPIIGFDIGYMSQAPFPLLGCTGTDCALVDPASTGAFFLGPTFLHYGGEVFGQGASHLYVMAPEIDLRMVINTAGGQPVSFAISPGGSLVGLRYTYCLGGSACFLAEVRGPALFAYVPLNGSKTSFEGHTFETTKAAPFGSAGATLSVGVGFN
jgi:hypothetical protein